MLLLQPLPYLILFYLLTALVSSQDDGSHTYPLKSNNSGAIFHNAALHPAADPYTFYDHASGLYHAYSTSGQDPGWLFAIYTSPDLSTWKRMPGGAMRACIDKGSSSQSGQMCWSSDWEAAKLGVAVSRSPRGPFVEIEPNPIDYYPYDPDYHDVNLIMDSFQRRPPPSRKAARHAPRGTYLSSIDPNLYFSPNAEEIYLYFSRAAYRNWNWDVGRGKYIEESEVIGVQLSTDWWNDPEAKTMPTIIDEEKNKNADRAWPLPENITLYNATGEIGYPPRKDGWKAVITYRSDPQAWENDSVDRYVKSRGADKDRRFAEGSTVISRRKADGTLIYLLMYSANSFQSENYGVGLAVSEHPLGPFRKSRYNPILTESFSTGVPIVSTGHGSIVASRPISAVGTHLSAVNTEEANQFSLQEEVIDAQRVMYETPPGSELFYVHHARNNSRAERALYTTRLTLHVEDEEDVAGKRAIQNMKLHLTASDQALPQGTTPIVMSIRKDGVTSCKGRNIVVELQILSGSGAAFELAEASNRVVLRGDDEDLTPLYSTLLEDEHTSLLLFRTKENDQKFAFDTIVYQRENSRGDWIDVVKKPASCR
ncbi:hypothetical protein CBS101457_005306 [Exobasidium rhododendri]|nr:hypothetical protein CBS101457_005306 [Exobasidium rhododendri]